MLDGPYLRSRRPRRGWRRRLGVSLRLVAGLVFWAAGPAIALGQGMMWLGGRLNGVAWRVERDR